MANKKKAPKSKEKPKLVLVDGAAGYLGSHVVDSFRSRGYKVRATDLPGSDLSYAKEAGAEIVYSNLLEPDSLKNLCKGADWVVHSAAAFNLSMPYEKLRAINVNGTENLCKAIVECGIKKMVHVSTGGVYGIPNYSPTDENHPYQPIEAYSKSKLESEEVVERYRKEHGFFTAVFRPSGLYGPRGKYVAGAFMTLPIIALEKGKNKMTVFYRKQQRQNWVHVKDVADASAFVLEQENIPSGEAFNLADSDVMTSEQYFDTYYRSFGITPEKKIGIPGSIYDGAINITAKMTPQWMWNSINKKLQSIWIDIVEKYKLEPVLVPEFSGSSIMYFAGDHVYDNSKLIAAGYKFLYPSYAEGLAETIKWYQENRWIPRFEDIRPG